MGGGAGVYSTHAQGCSGIKAVAVISSCSEYAGEILTSVDFRALSDQSIVCCLPGPDMYRRRYKTGRLLVSIVSVGSHASI